MFQYISCFICNSVEKADDCTESEYKGCIHMYEYFIHVFLLNIIFIEISDYFILCILIQL